jgi:hypothetical protein
MFYSHTKYLLKLRENNLQTGQNYEIFVHRLYQTVYKICFILSRGSLGWEGTFMGSILGDHFI